jgi:hypothetical protein
MADEGNQDPVGGGDLLGVTQMPLSRASLDRTLAQQSAIPETPAEANHDPQVRFRTEIPKQQTTLKSSHVLTPQSVSPPRSAPGPSFTVPAEWRGEVTRAWGD